MREFFLKLFGDKPANEFNGISMFSWTHILYLVLIIGVVVLLTFLFRKRFLFNFASISGILCAIVFFAYPGVGFKSPYVLFDDVYSIASHSLLLITSISLITRSL